MPFRGFRAAFGDIIRPAHGEVAGEQEDLLPVLFQPAAESVAGVVPGVPVAQPVVRPAEGGGGVVAFEQVIEDLLVQGGVAADAGLPDGCVGLAQDRDNACGPALQAAGARFRDRPAPADDVLGALLDAREAGEKVLVAGVAVGDQVSGERGRDRGGDRALAAGADGLQETSAGRPGPGDQHVRRPGRGLAVLLLRVRLVLLLRRRSRGGPVQHVHRGLSAASTSCPASAASIASSNPAFPSRAFTRAAALSTQPADTSMPSSMPMTCAARSGGTFP